MAAVFAALIQLLLASGVLAQGIESVLAPGQLIQGHAKLDDACTKCHVRFDRNAQDGQCMDCHKEVAQDMRAKLGFHGRLKPQACRSCHTDHKGRDARIAQFDKTKFDHLATNFALVGGHRKVDCAKCHVPGKGFRIPLRDCNACHRKDDPHKGSLGPKCADCHVEANWKEARFDHETTRFSLTGKHTDVKCAECHKNNQYKDTPRACLACHKKDDKHKGLLGEKCESCHDAKAWKGIHFNHDTDTRYALLGKHRAAKCESCHTAPVYKQKLSTTCNDCHVKDDKHKGSLGTACANCHTERDWKEPAKFSHDRTDFPLLGKHSDVQCKDCHKSQNYKEAPKQCFECHQKDDKHKGTSGTACASCHSERNWKEVSKFNHAKTDFPLVGKHVTVVCKECHLSLLFKEAPKPCIGCHRKDDKHKGALGEKCADCHSERNWKDTSFDHDKTRYPLLGKHKKVECSSCHKSTNYKETPRDCYSCHQRDDKHEGQQGRNCATCHVESDWKSVARFDHGLTRFPLLGKHAKVECKSCHASSRFKDAKLACVSCHVKDDKHKQTLGPACEQCHNARSWKTWDFDHDKRTKFVLDGKHKGLVCSACHTKPMEARVTASSLCVSCHAKDDIHEGGFGKNCQQCHVTTVFRTIKSQIGRP